MNSGHVSWLLVEKHSLCCLFSSFCGRCFKFSWVGYMSMLQNLKYRGTFRRTGNNVSVQCQAFEKVNKNEHLPWLKEAKK